MTGETSYFLDKLPLSRFEGELQKHHKVTW